MTVLISAPDGWGRVGAESRLRELAKMANETDDGIERAATAEFKKYADRVKDIDDLAGVQLMA